MGRLRREVGFWASVGRLRVGDLWSPEIIGGVLLGVGAGVLAERYTQVDARVTIAGDFMAPAATLIGVVFAALALVVALMSDEYLRMLGSVKGGVLAFLGNFMLVIGLLVGSLLSAVVYRATAARLPTAVEQWAFGALAVLFAVSTLEVVALTRSVLMHGLARGRLLEVSDLDAQRDQRRRTG